MRLWVLSVDIVLALYICGYILVQYSESHFDGMARWHGATASVEFVKSAVADLQSKNFDALEAKSDSSIVNKESRSAFARISGQLTSTPPKSIRLAALSWTRGHTMLSLEYGIDDEWFLVNAQVRTNEEEPPILERFNLQPIPAPLENFNRLSLQGKGGIHYFFLAFLIATGTCNVAALITCLRQKMILWRKIIWLVGILSGFGTFALNWTSGSLQFQLLSIHIPATGLMRTSLAAPYVLWFSVPVFAISFLFHHLGSPQQIETDAAHTLPSGS